MNPVLVWLKVEYGWPSVFFVTGLIGLPVVFRILPLSTTIRRSFPVQRRRDRLDRRERRHPRSVAPHGGAARARRRIPWRDLGVALVRRKLWGIYFGHFVYGCSGMFFRTWFITYLVNYRHFTFIKAGLYGSMPFVTVFLGVLVSGALSDLMVRRGFSLTFARKAADHRRPDPVHQHRRRQLRRQRAADHGIPDLRVFL